MLPVHPKLKMQVTIELRPIATPGQLSLNQQYIYLNKSNWCIKRRFSSEVVYIYIYGVDVVEGAGRKAKRMVLQCINGVDLNPVQGRTQI